jgi:hypothetical protein
MHQKAADSQFDDSCTVYCTHSFSVADPDDPGSGVFFIPLIRDPFPGLFFPNPGSSPHRKILFRYRYVKSKNRRYA